MLLKENRLKEKKDFRRTYQRGKSLANSYLVLYYRYSGSESYRIGFSVSKKIGNAVIRNKVKRRLREICRRNSNIFLLGYDYVFIVRKPVVTIDYHQLEEQVFKLVSKMQKIVNK